MAQAYASYPSTTLRVVPLPEQARGGFQSGDHDPGSFSSASAALAAVTWGRRASSTASTPAPVTPERGRGRAPASASSSADKAAISSSSSVSDLLRAITSGLSARPAP